MKWRLLSVLVPVLAFAVIAVATADSGDDPAAEDAAARPLTTGIVDPETFSGPDGALAMARTRAAGASIARIQLYWSRVAPNGFDKPAGFDAADHTDPRYRWASVDRQIRRARAAGLQPLISISSAPAWAQLENKRVRNFKPDPAELAAFARAAATRYSSTTRAEDGGTLPRVKYWQTWNEANHRFFLAPQEENGRLVAAEHYRKMLAAVDEAVKAVHRDNVTVTGGLAPFGGEGAGRGTQPMRFMRELLCTPEPGRPRPRCTEPARFDIWSHHPYTSGGPTHKAILPDSASLGDLPRMKRLLDAADRAGRIRHDGPLRFWVTEFSWDSDPPDSGGVPERLRARWVAEALYRMWRTGVSLVTWFTLRDYPGVAEGHTTVGYDAGLYFHGGRRVASDRPKLTLSAFRFPFVALGPRRPGTVTVWGRTPSSRPGPVRIEQRDGSRWRLVGTLEADRVGIFTARLRVPGAGELRARAERSVSVPFALGPTPELKVRPFGTS